MAFKKPSNVGELEQLLIKARDRYYNQKPIMDDKTYDHYENVLRKYKPQSIIFKTVGAPVKGRKKVQLEIPMPSLDKIYPSDGTASKWLKNEEYVVTDKLDGNSGQEVFENGKLVQIATRGDGMVGKDISHLIPHINGPKTIKDKKRLIVRGEFIMKRKTFQDYYSKDHGTGDFENARNLASGVSNNLKVHDAASDIDFVAYDILEPRMKQSEALALLKRLGFNTVWHKIVKNPTATELSKLLKQRIQAGSYEIDGLVVTENRKTNAPSSNPSFARAFKENSPALEATVKAIHWSIAKTGAIKPRVEIYPLRIDGVTVRFATGHNAKYIKDNKLGPGAKILLTRSGQVIPYVEEVIKPAKQAQMPDKSFGDYVWKGVDIYTAQDTDEAFIKTSYDFLFNGLNVEGIGVKTVEQLVLALDIQQLEEWFDITVDEIANLDGWSTKSALKLVTQIKAARVNADINKVAATCGIFGRNFGERRMKAITKLYNIFDLAKKPKQQVVATIASIHGFEKTTANQFANGLSEFVAFVKDAKLKFVDKAVKATGNLFENKNVVITGFRNSAIQDFIEQQGGKVTNSANSKTYLVIRADKDTSNNKTVYAQNNGITLMTEDQFRKKYM